MPDALLASLLVNIQEAIVAALCLCADIAVRARRKSGKPTWCRPYCKELSMARAFECRSD